MEGGRARAESDIAAPPAHERCWLLSVSDIGVGPCRRRPIQIFKGSSPRSLRERAMASPSAPIVESHGGPLVGRRTKRIAGRETSISPLPTASRHRMICEIQSCKSSMTTAGLRESVEGMRIGGGTEVWEMREEEQKEFLSGKPGREETKLSGA